MIAVGAYFVRLGRKERSSGGGWLSSGVCDRASRSLTKISSKAVGRGVRGLFATRVLSTFRQKTASWVEEKCRTDDAIICAALN